MPAAGRFPRWLVTEQTECRNVRGDCSGSGRHGLFQSGQCTGVVHDLPQQDAHLKGCGRAQARMTGDRVADASDEIIGMGLDLAGHDILLVTGTMPLQVGLPVSVPLAALTLVINPPIAIGRVVLRRRWNPVKVRGIERHSPIGLRLPLVALLLFF